MPVNIKKRRAHVFKKKRKPNQDRTDNRNKK